MSTETIALTGVTIVLLFLLAVVGVVVVWVIAGIIPAEQE